MKVINNGRPLFGPHANGMLDMFSSVDPGLVVDVGAAAGHITRYLLNVSPASHAVAFEPFPGNWKFIEKTLGGDCRATIVRKAVADKEGEASFFVSSTAKGDWQAMSGYSSVGYVMSDDQAKENGKAIKVPVTTLDNSITEVIRFLKVDVQGGEMAVLRGAEKCFRRGIEVLYVEFSGEEGILDHLFERDYVVFDHHYVLVPTKTSPDLSFWDLTREVGLSTGTKALYAWPKELPSDPGAFRSMFVREREKIGALQTDIIAVRRDIATGLGWIS